MCQLILCPGTCRNVNIIIARGVDQQYLLGRWINHSKNIHITSCIAGETGVTCIRSANIDDEAVLRNILVLCLHRIFHNYFRLMVKQCLCFQRKILIVLLRLNQIHVCHIQNHRIYATLIQGIYHIQNRFKRLRLNRLSNLRINLFNCRLCLIVIKIFGNREDIILCIQHVLCRVLLKYIHRNRICHRHLI